MKLPVFFMVVFICLPFSAQMNDPLKHGQYIERELFQPNLCRLNGPPFAEQYEEAVGQMRMRAALTPGGGEPLSSVYGADPQIMVSHQLTVQQLLNRSSNLSCLYAGERMCGVAQVCDDQTLIRKDRTTRYDVQNIVALQDDPAVLQAASSLFEKHPIVSTLLLLQKESLLLLKGSGAGLTACSRVVLVGHGARGDDGSMMLGGYRAEELARVVRIMKIENGQVRTLSLVGCELARDLRFAERLLKALRDLGVETTLHLRMSPLSVGPHGEKLTRDERDSEGGVWRHKDGSVKVIAQLDHSGNLDTRVEESRRGQIIPGYQGHVLQERPWPTEPVRFVPQNWHNTNIKILEAYAWAIFSERDQRSQPLPAEYKNDICWNESHKNEFTNNDNILIIETINDVVNEITYHAKYVENKYVFYMLNDFIYQVNPKDMYVHLIGKHTPGNNTKDDIACKKIKHYKAETYADILRDLNSHKSFHWFCQETFVNRPCYQDCDKWGHYFMAAVFSESVRNFRQFGVFLINYAACHFSGYEDNVCALFVDDNPMARGGSWVDTDKRGFYGWDEETADSKKVFISENRILKESSEKIPIDPPTTTALTIINKIFGQPVIQKDLFDKYKNHKDE